jgi:type II pantothenate kinase
LENIDLRIKDISKKSISPTLSSDITASNFGKMSETATAEDIALGVINMIFETAATLSIFAAREKGCADIILIGHLSEFPQAKTLFKNFEKTFPVKFIIPEHASHATAIGAALIENER